MFYLLCIICTFFAFANPFLQIGFLVIFYPLLFIHISNECDKLKDSIKLSWIAGSIIYSSCLYWIAYPIYTYSNVPLLVAIACPILIGLYLGIYSGIFSGILFFIKRNNWFIKGLIASLTWSSLEYIRAYFLTGFPWINIPQALTHYTKFIQPIQIMGESLFSGIIVIIVVWIYEAKNRKIIPPIAGVVSILLIYIWGSFLYNKNIDYKSEIKAIIIQGNINQYVKWDKKYQLSTLKKYIELTDKSLDNKGNNTLVVWPETAMPFYLQERNMLSYKLLNYLREKKIILLTGAPAYKIDKDKIRWYNRAYLIYNGRIRDYYDKVHLVPFGEYIPFGKVLGFLGKIVEGPGDFSSGRVLKPLKIKDLAIGTLICYEIIFPDLVAQLVKNKANLIVNISNDAWFGNSSGPYQHLNLAILKAIETNRFIIRATNSGISAIISPKGEIVKKLSLNREGFLKSNVFLIEDYTFYVKYHKIIEVLTILLCVFLLFINIIV